MNPWKSVESETGPSNPATVFTDFVMTYLITAASYWFKFKFRFLCSLRPLFKKREEKGAYIRNKISPITFEWLKSVFKCLNSIQNNCCFEGYTVWFLGYSIQAVRNSVNRIFLVCSWYVTISKWFSLLKNSLVSTIICYIICLSFILRGFDEITRINMAILYVKI